HVHADGTSTGCVRYRETGNRSAGRRRAATLRGQRGNLRRVARPHSEDIGVCRIACCRRVSWRGGPKNRAENGLGRHQPDTKGIPHALRFAELLFPHHDGLRHSATQWRRARQARLPGQYVLRLGALSQHRRWTVLEPATGPMKPGVNEMSNLCFLITGATGATGGAAAAQLLDEGERVRAFVHREDERSEALRKRGAEIVVGDLLDFGAVREALKGVDRAYFVYPIRSGLI